MPEVRSISSANLSEILRFNDPFVKWVIRILTILYLITQIPFVLKIFVALPWLRWLRVPNAYTVADGLQVLAMALLVGPCWLVQTRGTERDDAKKQVALEASNQFQGFWVWLVAMWLFFYLTLFLRVFVGSDSRIWDAGIDLLNNLQGLLLFLCYWVLTTITVSTSKEENQKPFPYALLFVWVLLFFVADVSLPGDERTRMVFRLLSGLWVGVSMGLLVGCLESEYLHVVNGRYPPSRRLVICLLYLYAVLQVSYVGFGFRFGTDLRPDLALVENVGSILSLPLKLLFIGLCYWLLREGRLEFYMQKTRKGIETTEADWQEFRGSAE
jgi:hypothetical protein